MVSISWGKTTGPDSYIPTAQWWRSSKVGIGNDEWAPGVRALVGPANAFVAAKSLDVARLQSLLNFVQLPHLGKASSHCKR